MDVVGNQGDHRSPSGKEKEDVPAAEEGGGEEGTDQRRRESSTPTGEGVYAGVHCVGRDGSHTGEEKVVGGLENGGGPSRRCLASYIPGRDQF